MSSTKLLRELPAGFVVKETSRLSAKYFSFTWCQLDSICLSFRWTGTYLQRATVTTLQSHALYRWSKIKNGNCKISLFTLYDIIISCPPQIWATYSNLHLNWLPPSMGMTHTEIRSWFWMTISLQCMLPGEILFFFSWFDGSKVQVSLHSILSPVCWRSSTRNSRCWKKSSAKSTTSRSYWAKSRSELFEVHVPWTYSERVKLSSFENFLEAFLLWSTFNTCQYIVSTRVIENIFVWLWIVCTNIYTSENPVEISPLISPQMGTEWWKSPFWQIKALIAVLFANPIHGSLEFNGSLFLACWLFGSLFVFQGLSYLCLG